MEFFFYGGMFLAIVGTIFFVSHKLENARTEKLKLVAEELGLQFHSAGDPSVQQALSHLHLFSRGRRRQTKNMITGHTKDVEIAIFGYRFVTGSGKNSQTHRQSVISFHSEHLSLPEFELRPERFFHKIGQAFGYKDIDFDSNPDFSSRYLLRGPNEPEIRELFTTELQEFFGSLQGVSVEARQDRFIYYRARRRIDPGEVKSFMEEGFRAYGLLKQVCDHRRNPTS